MLKNYFITAFRSLKRFKLFTFLNLFGLSTGMACSILIMLWVQDEKSYDKFTPNAAEIYRLTSNVSGSIAAVTPPPVVDAVKQQIPAVENVTHGVPISATVSIGDKKFDEKNLLYADANFLQFFNYPLVRGNGNVLGQPNQVVITASTAIKYFGTENAVGKTLKVENGYNSDYIVSGVLKNLPHNSHLQFSMLLPISYYYLSNGEDWGNFSAYSYVKLDKHFNATSSSIALLEKQIDLIHQKNDQSNTKSRFTLQPLTDIHLTAGLQLDVEGQGNMQNVKIFSIAAIFILVIACINFMNLSTALGSTRAKEVGLRKTIGARRIDLIVQLMGESLLVALLALMIGVLLAWFLLPLFNELASKNIGIDLLNGSLIAQLLAIAVFVGLISGSYPAIFISSFNPVKALKGIKAPKGELSYLRSGLVIFQFAVSVVLIISTLIVNNQLDFIRKRDIGFNKQNLLYIQVPQVGYQKANYDALKQALQLNNGIADYTIVDHLPTNLTTGTTDVVWSGKDPNMQTVFPHIGADASFLKTFGMKLIAGRMFNANSIADDSTYLVNQTALKIMGIKPAAAVGQKISTNGNQGTIIGVVQDFNFKPVQQAIEPLIIRHNNRAGFVVIRTSGADYQQIIGNLKDVIHNLYPNYPYNYGFVDQDIAKLYVTEQRTGMLFNVFSIMSVIISCLGLFGLATFAIQKRVKEIGVRRVLGASAQGIVAMLSADFIKLVGASLLVAFPVSWYIMHQWLANYAYRITISWWVFAISGICAVLIALITVSYQSVKAAYANPVKSLRND
ncbi:ABC transporter permease [Mucilaginibacter sp. UR6-1]|uniref:ABC transporter permease n=1 Tax=Mucilaginibacter sp. UR6-1 TaxID=1435643 RepID=UPI001E4E4C21|nr:ABC transporter permease [Mucilaginibacter sp. UR6-1]MCC8407579.1 ABC transporter permease [Mucilaginibacter sp. UR6-1]